MTYALIATLLVLLAFAMLALHLWRGAYHALVAENAELRSAIEYRDEIIENRLAKEEPLDVDVECQCPRCLREAYSVN